jgi:hypothetical protein
MEYILINLARRTQNRAQEAKGTLHAQLLKHIKKFSCFTIFPYLHLSALELRFGEDIHRGWMRRAGQGHFQMHFRKRLAPKRRLSLAP